MWLRRGQVVGIISSAITTIDRCFERIIPDVKMSRSGRRRYCTLDKKLNKRSHNPQKVVKNHSVQTRHYGTTIRRRTAAERDKKKKKGGLVGGD